MKLIIVESYNKIKSIKKFMGDNYEVIASGGHIRELKSSGYGFNKDTLMPIWEPYEKKNNKDEKTIAQVKRHAKSVDEILIATDPDREGESIAWHLFDILPESDQKKCVRITFNEITKKAVESAIASPRDIDMNLVQSQWARRILDRFVGYGLSSLVKSKLRARSAGRVQSVALLFIVERFKEIQMFKPSFWWTIEINFQDNKINFPAFLREPSQKYKVYEKETSEFKFADRNDAEKCLSSLGETYKIYKIDEPTISNIKTLVPFQTDTLLTTAYNKLGWSTSKTNKIAQELYNGINMDGEVVSLISYPRTDTNRLNDDFIINLRKYLAQNYGEEYVCHNVKAAASGDLVQGAHEGIRPIDISITPKSLEGKVKDKNASDLIKLYTLIWTQTAASFMNPPAYKTFVYRLINNDNKFYTSYKRLHFKGYYALPHYKNESVDSKIDLSHLKVDDVLKVRETPNIIEHQTEPPGLFNEGSLVKELKKSGVGRPSTYSTMVNIVKDRGYVLAEKKLNPTELGILLIDSLVKECGDFVSKEFTIEMETQLDKIADGKVEWNKWLKEFKVKFDDQMIGARKNMPKVEQKLVGRKCPTCNNELVYQVNRRDRSQFIGCVNFKEGCKYTETLSGEEKPKPILLDEKCPQCEKQLIQRFNKRGEPFIACTGFPKCRYIKSMKKVDNKTENKSDEQTLDTKPE